MSLSGEIVSGNITTGEVPSEVTRSVVFSVIVDEAIQYLDLKLLPDPQSELLASIPAGTLLGVIGLKNNYYQVVYSGII